MWLGWTILTALSACTSAVVIIVILSRRRLRTTTVNQYVVGLAFPDFAFSLLCGVTCFEHYMHGRWFGGDAMCIFQSVYCMYGMTSSVWMNVAIARELDRMARSPVKLQTYKPRHWKEAAKQIVCVHAAALSFACVSLIPGVPADVGATRGLACLPMEYDLPSTIFHWLFTMNLFLLLPMIFIIFYFKRVRDNLNCLADDDVSSWATVRFFARLLTTYLLCWLPAGILIFVTSFDAPIMDAAQYVGGSVSHAQGIVSAVLYLSKADIRNEIRTILLPRRSVGHRIERAESALMIHVPSHRSSVARISAAKITAMMDLVTTEVMQWIMARQTEPMAVIEFLTWLELGHIPCSSEKTHRELRPESDVVCFVSHRWWGDSVPDDEEGSKYDLLCHGLQRLIRQQQLDKSRVVIWCDWACIEQDDKDAKSRGVASLIAYAAQSSFMLIPVSSDEHDTQNFHKATHPTDLSNYGERAWCRLEAYIYSCVAEATQRPPHIFAVCQANASCLWQGVMLKPLFSSKEAFFAEDGLPSQGDLTEESDREYIAGSEETMRSLYVRSAILQQKLHILKHQVKSCVLQGKQLACTDITQLQHMLLDGPHSSRLTRLNLAGNLLAESGVQELFETVICSTETPSLAELDLSNNKRLGTAGIAAVAEGLTNPLCHLRVLKLGDCGLDAAAIADLVKALPQATSLRYLDLSRNPIDDASGHALLQAAGGIEAPRLALDLEATHVSVKLFRMVAKAQASLALGVAAHDRTKWSFGRTESDASQVPDTAFVEIPVTPSEAYSPEACHVSPSCGVCIDGEAASFMEDGYVGHAAVLAMGYQCGSPFDSPCHSDDV